MKRIFNIPNLIMLVQLLLSATVTVMLVFYKSFDEYVIVLLQVFAFIGIVLVRFARPISEILDRLCKAFLPENTVDSPKEKSAAMLFFVKFAAYITIGVQVVFLFIF